MGALPLIPVVTNETGTYEVHDEAGVVWTYGLTVSGLGTKSEHHIGVLRINNVELHDAVKGVRVNTPWGQMQFFHSFSDHGFLLAGFGGHPIDPSVGTLLSAPNPEPANAKAVAHVAEWRFEVVVKARFSRSEGRAGRLWRGNAEVQGYLPNQGLETPWGTLCFTKSAHDPSHQDNSGWLLWGTHDNSPWQDSARLRCLESLYLDRGSALGHKVVLALPDHAEFLEEWEACLWTDPNTCTTNDFGDREVCTKMAIRKTNLRGSRARTEDPKRAGRRIYLLSDHQLPQPLHLVVDAHGQRWFLKSESELIALYPVNGLLSSSHG